MLKNKMLFQLFKDLKYIDVVIICRHFGLDGLQPSTDQEIAQVLGKGVRGVRKRLERAMAHIKNKVASDPKLSDGLASLLDLLARGYGTDSAEEFTIDSAEITWLKTKKQTQYQKHHTMEGELSDALQKHESTSGVLWPGGIGEDDPGERDSEEDWFAADFGEYPQGGEDDGDSEPGESERE